MNFVQSIQNRVCACIRSLAVLVAVVASFAPAAFTLCHGNYNRDGGFDGGDIDAFFAAWEAGDPAADVNADGATDGGDIGVFFTAWEGGLCL